MAQEILSVDSIPLVNVGDEIKLTKDIWEHGSDYSPPGWLARLGEVLVVRKLGKNGHITVSHHHITDNSFWIDPTEYKMHQSLPSIISTMKDDQSMSTIDNETQMMVNTVLSFSDSTPRVVSSWQREYLEPFKRYIKEADKDSAQADKFGFIRLVLDRAEKTIVDVKVLHLELADNDVRLIDAPKLKDVSEGDIEVNAVLRFNEFGTPEVYVSWTGDQPAGYSHHQPNVRFLIDGASKRLKSIATIEPVNNHEHSPVAQPKPR
ncbi:MAG: hypothetical protein CTY38_00810 [Methylotenera sp.]|uniref:hypothetical protein n=1 Tax=Methylotenera sp. TaxID=2051956 RepID=UPI000D4D0FDE|nr:hypothetical protein [Methylotenera sp.]PPC84619.1 MAG: hypothetical protein CTY38_00810 [Methylotenera sp.]